MNPKNASVIIPAWNGRAHLPACLEALLAQAGVPFEAIVVDNGSSDGSADLIAERFPGVKLIRHERNLGYAGGCNAGLKAARGELLVLLNQDTVVEPGWLTALMAAFESPAIGIAGCKCFFPGGSLLQHAGAYIDWPLGFSHHFGYRELDSPEMSVARQVEFVTGAALAMRRGVCDRIGFLDEGYWPGYYEDVDFCFRARSAGFEVWYWPAARLVHLEGQSPLDPSAVHEAVQRGRMRFLLKHFPVERLLSEFFPAEREYLEHTGVSELGLVLRYCYLRSALKVADLFDQRGAGAMSSVGPVVSALLDLYQAGWHTEVESLKAACQALAAADASSESEPASLRSLADLVQILGRVRRAWLGQASDAERQRRRERERLMASLLERLERLIKENSLLSSYAAQCLRHASCSASDAEQICSANE